jgi:hypothetical protein
MIIDYIEAIGIFTGKDTPFFGYLKKFNENHYTGRITYKLKGCKDIDILYNPSNGILILRGSIMYYWQGHNFTYDKMYFVEAINHIGHLLHIESQIWGMQLNILEYGVIMEVEEKPKDIIGHHREGKGLILFENPKDKGLFRSYNDKSAERKMYDAGKNIINKQGREMRSILVNSGWNPEKYYLKWEVHYLKPELLNQYHGILLSDLTNPKWEDVLKKDIYKQYKKIIPMKCVIPPIDKSEFHTLDIFAMELVESKLNEGRTLSEVKKLLYDRINASSILSKPDKDARKKQVKATLDKLQESEDSVWDISQKLKTALNLNDENDSG